MSAGVESMMSRIMSDFDSAAEPQVCGIADVLSDQANKETFAGEPFTNDDLVDRGL